MSAGLDCLPSESPTGREKAKISEGENWEERILREADAESDVEGLIFVEVMKEVLGQNLRTGFGVYLRAI